MREKQYPREVAESVEKQIPKEILDALIRNGWNIFGIFELVKQELKKKTKSQD